MSPNAQPDADIQTQIQLPRRWVLVIGTFDSEREAVLVGRLVFELTARTDLHSLEVHPVVGLRRRVILAAIWMLDADMTAAGILAREDEARMVVAEVLCG